VLLITYVLYIGISESARLNSIIVGIKLSVIVAVIVVGAFFVEPKKLESVCADGLERGDEGRGGNLLRVHRLRRGLDPRLRKSSSRIAICRAASWARYSYAHCYTSWSPAF